MVFFCIYTLNLFQRFKKSENKNNKNVKKKSSKMQIILCVVNSIFPNIWLKRDMNFNSLSYITCSICFVYTYYANIGCKCLPAVLLLNSYRMVYLDIFIPEMTKYKIYRVPMLAYHSRYVLEHLYYYMQINCMHLYMNDSSVSTLLKVNRIYYNFLLFLNV